MWSFLCSDGRSNKTLSAGSPTVEIKFTTVRGLKKCIDGSTMGKNKCGTTFLNQAPRQLRESTKVWTSLIHNAEMDRAQERTATNIILDDQKKSARAFGYLVDDFEIVTITIS